MLILIATAVGGVLAVRYEGTSYPGRVDREVADVLDGWPTALRVIVHLGDPGPLALLVVLVALAAAAMRRGVVFALVAPPCAVLVSGVVLKPLVGRTLGEGLAYPSNHMTGVGAVLVVIWVLVASCRGWPRGARWTIFAVLLVVGAGHAATLAALSLHYATDTVGGACVAVAVVLVCALVNEVVAAGFSGDRRE